MDSLENQLLIAMPNLGDPYFNKTVTYICEHNDDGAMGLIINLPVNLTLNELLMQIAEESGEENPNDQSNNNSLLKFVLSGGPIAQQRGFVLHSPQHCWNSSLSLNNDIMITTSKDILLSLGTQQAPENYMVALGYAGWAPGQLENELQANSWLTTPVDTEILFNVPVESRWKKSTEKIGIDISRLSSDIGHA